MKKSLFYESPKIEFRETGISAMIMAAGSPQAEQNENPTNEDASSWF